MLALGTTEGSEVEGTAITKSDADVIGLNEMLCVHIFLLATSTAICSHACVPKHRILYKQFVAI